MKFFTILASINAEEGKAPGRFLLFKAGWNEVVGDGEYLVDKKAFDLLTQYRAKRGNDVVFDYEHQTLEGGKAPAAGWITKLEWEDGKGIFATVTWTDEAAGYITKGEYRYHSPVFFVRKSDKRLTALHSVALTNSPKHNHLTPILAKLGADFDQSTNREDSTMDFWEKLFAKLGLEEGASEEDVFAAIAKLGTQKPDVKEVVAKGILDALELGDGDASTSTVVASIHALKQGQQGVVSREEFQALQKKLVAQDVSRVVAKAMNEGKITPDQKEWATKYATDDLEGFETFVSKAPVVVPLEKLPGKTTEAGEGGDLDATTLAVAKQMGVDTEDLKKYGGLDQV